GASVWHGLREGLAYAFGSGPIKTLLALVALISLFGVPYTVLLPVYVREVLHGGPEVLGLVLAAPGVGAVTGALLLASRSEVLGLLRWIAWAPGLVGAGLLGFSLTATLAPALALLVVVGFSVMVLLTSCNTALQSIVDEDKRGRVMSLYAM